MVRHLLAPIYWMLDFPLIYLLNQALARPTTTRIQQLIQINIGDTRGRSILDIGCGIANYRRFFQGPYTGVDINQFYVEKARTRYPDRFEVMDATNLNFPPHSFDDAVAIATAHHLTDEEFTSMLESSLRVLRPGGFLHIIDAILPVSPNYRLKRLWFRLDRGCFPREMSQLLVLANRAGEVRQHRIVTGPLHDVAYIRVASRQIR